MPLMCCICVGIGGMALGFFLALMAYAWLENSLDPYVGIVIPGKRPTCISWDFRLAEAEHRERKAKPARRPGGHLGHMDHKARERYTAWISKVGGAG